MTAPNAGYLEMKLTINVCQRKVLVNRSVHGEKKLTKDYATGSF
jgi:hypothetical protein